MRIGIDMDDTICCTTEMVNEYAIKYLKDNKLSSDELWGIKANKDKFFRMYFSEISRKVSLKANVTSVLKKLKRDGNLLYIVTLRGNLYVDNMLEIIECYLEKHGIEVDGIFTHCEDKADICIRNNIDVMIDDNRSIYDSLVENGVGAILFDDKRKNLDVLSRVENWNEILEFLANNHSKNNIMLRKKSIS